MSIPRVESKQLKEGGIMGKKDKVKKIDQALIDAEKKTGRGYFYAKAMEVMVSLVKEYGKTHYLAGVLTGIIHISVGVLRGLYGTEFVDTFLTDGINDKGNVINLEPTTQEETGIH